MPNHSIYDTNRKSLHDFPCTLVPILECLYFYCSGIVLIQWWRLFIFSFHIVPKSFTHQEIGHPKLSSMEVILVKLLTLTIWLMPSDILSAISKQTRKATLLCHLHNYYFLTVVLYCTQSIIINVTPLAYIHPMVSL